MQQLRVSTQTMEFEEYFTKFYVQRKTQWATCYRKKSGINTNMYVESFHGLVKYIYMRGRANKRIDKLLYILMKVSRDKAFERLCKLEKGKITGRVATIRRRHEESKNICSELLNQFSENQWTVASSHGSNVYTVRKETNQCIENCQLQCKDCNICIRIFSCTCMDAILNYTICKLVHFVASKNKLENRSTLATDSTLTSKDLLLNEAHTSLLKTAVPQHKEKNIQTRLQHKLLMMSMLKSVTDMDVLLSVEKNVNAAMSLLNVSNTIVNDAPLLPKHYNPPNKHITPQRGFFSTKKELPSHTKELPNPQTERRIILRKH